MPGEKFLSQITPAPSAPRLTDQLVGVSGGNADYLYSLSQIQAGLGTRTLLPLVPTGDVNVGVYYYVSTTGSDSNPGTQAQPWATAQHAVDWVGTNLDGNGNWIIISFADGTYIGPAISVTAPNARGTMLLGHANPLDGSSPNPALVVFTDGGAPISQGYFAAAAMDPLSGVVEFYAVSFSPTVTDFHGFVSDASVPAQAGFHAVKFNSPAGGGQEACRINNALGSLYFGFSAFFNPGHGSEDFSGNWKNALFTQENAFVVIAWYGSGTISGTYSEAIIRVSPGTAVFDLQGSMGGSPTGVRFIVDAGSGIFGSGVTSLTAIPGSLPGVINAGGRYVSTTGAQPVAGVPTAADIAAASWGLFKNTAQPTGLGVTIEYNDAGTLVTLNRQLLQSDATFYVSTTGSDSNPGSAGLPWATIQHAFDYIAVNIDAGGHNVIIQLGNGTYPGATMNGVPLNFATYTIQGNLSNQSLVTIQDTVTGFVPIDIECATVNLVIFDHIHFQATLGAAGSVAIDIGPSDLQVSNCTIDNIGGAGSCSPNFASFSQINFVNVTIQGAWNSVCRLTNANCVDYFNGTNTFVGTPSFAVALISVETVAIVIVNAGFSGAFTGLGYAVSAGTIQNVGALSGGGTVIDGGNVY